MTDEPQANQHNDQNPNTLDQNNTNQTESQAISELATEAPTPQQQPPAQPMEQQATENVPPTEVQNSSPELAIPSIGQVAPVNNSATASTTPPLGQTQSPPIPQQSPSTDSDKKEPPTNPLSYILQWVTYALWGWTLVALSVLVFIVFNSIVAGDDTGDAISYSIAAVLVLLPISYVCDRFYARVEPQQKKGVAMAIMLIHAVIFTLFSVGFVITTVFFIVAALTGDNDSSESTLANVASSIIMAVLYLVTLLRTINPEKAPAIRRFYPLFMTLAVGVIALAGIVGPARTKAITKNDRLIETNIQSVNRAVQDYTRSKNELPNSLADVSLDENAKLLVDKNLVTYKKGNIETTAQKYSTSSYKYQTNYNYTICATFTRASTKNSNGSSYDTLSKSYISAYNHKQGEVCYDQTTQTY